MRVWHGGQRIWKVCSPTAFIKATGTVSFSNFNVAWVQKAKLFTTNVFPGDKGIHVFYVNPRSGGAAEPISASVKAVYDSVGGPADVYDNAADTEGAAAV